MKVLNNVDLSKYNTFKIGGIAKNFYVPKNTEELIVCLQNMEECENIYILSGGSNLLINDKKIYEHVIYCKKLNDYIKPLGNGRYCVGAGVKIQRLINRLHEDGYGGIEYLYSLPALVGGIVVMNAGRGKGHEKSISDFVERVYVVRNGEEIVIEKKECGFNYRTSIFKGSNDIVVAVDLCFEKVDTASAQDSVKERMEYVKISQERNKANFGSVFCSCNPKIMEWVKKLSCGKKDGVHYSSKTPNWLVNEGRGTYKQARRLITFVSVLHKIVGRDCKIEVQIWN